VISGKLGHVKWRLALGNIAEPAADGFDPQMKQSHCHGAK
jgi:hypothetical protein